jgi:hypothetical protein
MNTNQPNTPIDTTLEYFKIILSSTNVRFPALTDASTLSHALRHQDSYSKLIVSVGAMNAASEAEVETYIDELAAVITRRCIPFTVAIPALISIQTPDVAESMNAAQSEGVRDY